MRLRLDRKRPGKLRVYEHAVQSGLFSWAGMQERLVPALKLLHAIPNGAATRRRLKATPAGGVISYSPEGKKLKREGLKTGIPDVHWPIARDGFHSLYIECKAPDKRTDVSDAQWEKIDQLREEGNCVVIVCTTSDAIAVVKWYFTLDMIDHPHDLIADVKNQHVWLNPIFRYYPPEDPPRRVHRVKRIPENRT